MSMVDSLLLCGRPLYINVYSDLHSVHWAFKHANRTHNKLCFFFLFCTVELFVSIKSEMNISNGNVFSFQDCQFVSLCFLLM